MSNTPSEEKTVSFKVFRDSVPRFSITYKDKKDLYESFQKKIAELDFDVGSIYWVDFDGDQSLIENADDLFAASKDNPNVKLFARVDNDVVSCSDIDEPLHCHHPHRRPHKRATMRDRQRKRGRSHSRNRSRSGSRDRSRSRSRSGSRSRSRGRSGKHFHGHRHFGPFTQMRAAHDRPTSLGPWDFPFSRCFFEGRHGSRQRRGTPRCPWAYWGFPAF